MTRVALRSASVFRPRHVLGILVVATVGLLAVQSVRAVGLTYVDADPTALMNLDPSGAIVFTTGDDGFWGERAFGAVNVTNSPTIYEAGIGEDVSEISQIISGLTPGNSYDLYVVYWSDLTDWRIQAGLTSGNLTLFNRLGSTSMAPGAQAGQKALLTAWDVPPVNTAATPLFFEGNRTLFRAQVGTAVADGSGQARVFLDDTPSAGGNARTWLDGVAYAPAGTMVDLMLGDFDRSGGPASVSDYQTLLTNLNTDITGLTVEQRYANGDINFDSLVDFADLSQFAVEFDMQNGEGAFAAMASSVPEPGAMLLAVLGGGLLLATSLRPSRLRKVGAKIRKHGLVLGAISAIAVGALTCLLWSSTASAAPVTGWAKDTSFGGGNIAILTNELTNAPTLGDGTADNASNTAIWATIPEITLAPGQQIVLTGAVDAVGGNFYTSALNSFRFGLFNNNGAADTLGWLGHWAQNSTAARNGNIATRNPAGTNFAGVTFASTAAGRAKTLALGGNEALFHDNTYTFNLTIGRFDDNSTTAFATLTSPAGYEMEVYHATETDPSILTFTYNRVGFLSASVFQADQMQFDSIDVSVQSIVAPTMRVLPTGAVSITNTTGAALDLKYYEIASEGGMLDTGGWASIDGTEGGDPVGTGWDVAGAPAASLLSEFNLEGSTMLAPGASISLGDAAQAGANDLRFYYGLPSGEVLRGFVQYGQPGDFDGDGDVDGADFVAWQTHFPTASGATLADGDADGDGDVDGADFVVWQTNFPFTPSGVSPVPEPSAVLLAIAGLIGLGVAARRRTSIDRI